MAHYSTYQLRIEISTFTESNMSVMVYFAKLKKPWDELTCLRPLLTCNCGAAKSICDIDNDEKLIRLLMGLGENYEQVKNQILLMDPPPGIN